MKQKINCAFKGSLPAALKVHAAATAGRVNDIQRTGIAFARKLSESAI
jgi:hypothetical protein